jgi:hypothetical protein
MLEKRQNAPSLDPKLSAIIAGAEDYQPPRTDKIIQGFFGPRVLLPGNDRTIDTFAADLVKNLADKPIFNHGGMVSIVDDKSFVLRRMTSTKFRTWIECRGGVCCNGYAGRGDNAELCDMSMSEECAKAVLDSPTFIDGLREVVRVNTVRLPIRRATGEIELLKPGYDPELKILTIETVKYDEDLPADKALEVFQKLLKDTAFDPEDRNRSEAVATAMILAPFCDCMLPRFDERPAFIVTANGEGAGKTTLIRMAICPVSDPQRSRRRRTSIPIS